MQPDNATFTLNPNMDIWMRSVFLRSLLLSALRRENAATMHLVNIHVKKKFCEAAKTLHLCQKSHCSHQLFKR